MRLRIGLLWKVCIVGQDRRNVFVAGGLVFAPLMAGAKLVLPGPHLDGSSIYDLMMSQRVTCTAGVPTVWMNLLDHLRQNKLRLEHLQRLVVGAQLVCVHVAHCWVYDHNMIKVDPHLQAAQQRQRR